MGRFITDQISVAHYDMNKGGHENGYHRRNHMDHPEMLQCCVDSQHPPSFAERILFAALVIVLLTPATNQPHAIKNDGIGSNAQLICIHV